MAVMGPIILIIGLAQRHGISTGKATFAVLLPFIAFAGLFLLTCGLNLLGIFLQLVRLGG